MAAGAPGSGDAGTNCISGRNATPAGPTIRQLRFQSELQRFALDRGLLTDNPSSTRRRIASALFGLSGCASAQLVTAFRKLMAKRIPTKGVVPVVLGRPRRFL